MVRRASSKIWKETSSLSNGDFEVFEGIFSATKRKVILIKLVHDLIMINDVGGKGRREILIEGRLFFAATKEEKSPLLKRTILSNLDMLADWGGKRCFGGCGNTTKREKSRSNLDMLAGLEGKGRQGKRQGGRHSGWSSVLCIVHIWHLIIPIWYDANSAFAVLYCLFIFVHSWISRSQKGRHLECCAKKRKKVKERL